MPFGQVFESASVVTGLIRGERSAGDGRARDDDGEPRVRGPDEPRAVAFSLRVSTAPFALARAAVSAAWSAALVPVTVASAGTGVGNEGLFVILVTMPVAYVMSFEAGLGSSREAIERSSVVTTVMRIPFRRFAFFGYRSVFGCDCPFWSVAGPRMS